MCIGGYDMTKDIYAQSTKGQTKGSFPKILGIGCLVVVLLTVVSFAVAFIVAGKAATSFLGQGFLQKTFEQATGITLKQNGNNTGVSVINRKTGESVTIGEEKIPADFPKDFPLYPNAQPAGSAVAAEKMTGKGFWLLLSSTDSLEQVIAFYDAQLEGKGWEIGETYTLGDGSTYQIKKEKLLGTLIISRDVDKQKTTILITLEPTNEKNPAPQEVGDDTAVPEELP